MFFLQALCDYAAISIENARWVEKIQELTITDDCTGLYNARHLYKTLEARSTARRVSATNSACCSSISATSSRSTTRTGTWWAATAGGDRIPDQSASRLIDFAFRYGGAEFVVLLPQTGKDSALVVAKRLRDALRAAAFCREESLNLNVRA